MKKRNKHNWLSPPVFISIDIANPIYMAQFVLDGYEESEVLKIWRELHNILDSQKATLPKHPKAGKKQKNIAEVANYGHFFILSEDNYSTLLLNGSGNYSLFDIFQYLEMLGHKDIRKMVDEYGKDKLLAVLILGEYETHKGEFNQLKLEIVKTEREMMLAYITESFNSDNEKKQQILASGRKARAYKSHEDAVKRHNGLRDAAVNFFIHINHTGKYDDCIAWLKDQPNLKPFRNYAKGKTLTDRRIKDIITGTKDIAFDQLAKRQPKP